MRIGREEHSTTSISGSNAETIIVRGHDLVGELIGKISFTDHVWLLVAGSLPSEAQRRVLDSTLVAIAEHGLVPSVVAARMTLAAAPEALWALMETVVDHSSSEAEIPGWTQFLAQAAAEVSDTSLALIHRDAVEPLFKSLAGLIALAWDRPAEADEVRMAAVFLLCQARSFGMHRQGTLVMMGWPDFADGRLETGKRCLKSLIGSLLKSPLQA